MNPDPDLGRLEERVRKAFPACDTQREIAIPQREPIPQAPFFPETSLDCWKPFLGPFTFSTGEMHTKNVTVHPPEQPTP